MKYQVLAAACLVSIDIANAIGIQKKKPKTGDNFKDPADFKSDVIAMNQGIYRAAGSLDRIRKMWQQSLNNPNWGFSMVDLAKHAKQWAKVTKPFTDDMKVFATVLPQGALLDSLGGLDKASIAFDTAEKGTITACHDLPDNVSAYVEQPKCYDAVKAYIAAEKDLGAAANDLKAKLTDLPNNQVFTDALAADKKRNRKYISMAKKSSSRAASAFGHFADLILSDKNIQYSEYDGKQISERALTRSLNSLKNALKGYSWLNDKSAFSSVSSSLREIASAANGLAAASDSDLAGPAKAVANAANWAAGQTFSNPTFASSNNMSFKNYLKSLNANLFRLSNALSNPGSKTLVNVGYDFASNTLDKVAQGNVARYANEAEHAARRVVRDRKFSDCTWAPETGTFFNQVSCTKTLVIR